MTPKSGEHIKTSDIIWQDMQHQELFTILDLVRDPASHVDILQKLKNYASSHFALEEQYMLLLDYPDGKAHIEAHDQFRAELDYLVSDHGKFHIEDREVIATFLSEWLSLHVMGIDKQLEEFILRSSAK